MAVEGVNLNYFLSKATTSQKISALSDSRFTSEQQARIREDLESHGVDINDYDVYDLSDTDFARLTGGNKSAKTNEEKKADYKNAENEQRNSMESHGEDQTSETVRSVASVGTAVGGGVAAAGALVASYAVINKNAKLARKGSQLAVVAGLGALAISAAVDAAVSSSKPHEKEYADIQNGMENDIPAAQQCMEDTQQEMEDAMTRAVELAEESDEFAKIATDEMAKQQEDYLGDVDAVKKLDEKIKNGTADECDKAERKAIVAKVGEYNDNNEGTVGEVEEVVKANGDEIEGQLEIFDTGSENIQASLAASDVYQGLGEATEDGANQDENSFKLMQTADNINAAGLTVSGGILLTKAAADAAVWNWVGASTKTVFAGLGFAGAVGSRMEANRMGKHAEDQAEIAQAANDMLNMNQVLRGTTEATSEQYESDVSVYDDALNFVKNDVKVEQPDINPIEDSGSSGKSVTMTRSAGDDGGTQGAKSSSSTAGKSKTDKSSQNTPSAAQNTTPNAQNAVSKDEKNGTDKWSIQPENGKAVTQKKDEESEDKVKRKDNVK